ncbi:hypothetical protein BJV85_002759 [Clostridium acetobutylicum]|uniref:SPOR domain-containing protein n=1 Tax=Clostridium acetobutylicum (strain ATCC 824 / DSM 792 / JCM 1419 / IAM 19013 / LMG 5710 / NBRC 13948 / NRRL B-527 / VKM B-1787 / 2291 / W) TaxID=272562 RepID=Q97JN5_CLOAB|nr:MULTISPECIES: hypothetical protein [Clostridium]AAK79210.1 Hypothetical protein CA_C1238 [Clostridium acetobutylicum ATCC 824]ADZ20289.1 Conserved hypothetical protein [Clostridium acetobutylicum EA 2018]AEI31732.1 hypothetical protein SMB_G1259 [Clostridium acetobutylicum DSM 1731]AWV81541.1 hypothetical protein DK921_15855 [Clostridium acetobutylicum]MBC2393180.1 hypothetical protein [Clostridium acetobutylicum]
MRYTRYDLKHRKSSSIPFLMCLTIILALSFFIGTFIFKTFIKGTEGYGNPQNISNDYGKKENGGKLFIIQCSANSKKENADKTLNSLENIGNPFEVKSNGLYKIIYAICAEKDYSSYEKAIKDNKIEFNKFTINLNKGDPGDAELYSIISAYLQAVNKLGDKDVKSVQTASLKKWCSNIKEYDDTYKNYKITQEIKKHIEDLPAGIDKNNLSNEETFLYNELVKIK